MLKILINNEEVLCNNDFTIKEELLNTSSVILNNVYPKSWEENHDYVNNFYYPKDYSKCKILNKEEITFTVNGNTTQSSTPTPVNPVQLVSKTGTITETIDNKEYNFNLGSIELCKVNNKQDYIYKSNNKWYLHKETGKIIIDGSENYTFEVSPNFNENRTRYTIYKMETEYTSAIGSIGALSNIAEYTPNPSQYSSYDNTFLLRVPSASQQTRIDFMSSTLGITTVDDFKNWISTNNIVILYELPTPTETEITNQQLITQLNQVGETLFFCGVVKNTGNISLNPRYPHFCSLQILDFKALLSEGETLDFVIDNKTVQETIQTIVNTISDYGFVLGNINISNPLQIINAYSTLNKTPYDVFQYIADITQSKWSTRMIDENTVAIDFYDPTLKPIKDTIEYTKEYFEENDIIDMTFTYSTNDYRNKQVMTSDEIFGNISQSQTVLSNGYNIQFNVDEKIGIINSITVDGTPATFTTKERRDLGEAADFYYKVGETYVESATTLTSGSNVAITYIPIVKGRTTTFNTEEISRINQQIDRKGIIARYENRNDALSSNELTLIGESYIKYKGNAEITLTVSSRNNLFNIADIIQFEAPIDELKDTYIVKSKEIERIIATGDIFYTFTLTNNYNVENEVNYFDNQRAKSKGNISEGQYITRNIDIDNTANIIFYGLTIEESTIAGDNTLNCTLNSPFVN